MNIVRYSCNVIEYCSSNNVAISASTVNWTNILICLLYLRYATVSMLHNNVCSVKNKQLINMLMKILEKHYLQILLCLHTFAYIQIGQIWRCFSYNNKIIKAVNMVIGLPIETVIYFIIYSCFEKKSFINEMEMAFLSKQLYIPLSKWQHIGQNN